MKKLSSILLLTFLIFVISISVSAQSGKSSATPPVDEDVVRISTTLIQIDVVATDKKGDQVTDLKPEDFEIYENGKKQQITNFSYIFNNNENKTQNVALQNPIGKFSVPPPPAKLKLEQVRRTYAIVVDDLGISFENIPAVKYSLKKFINEQMLTGDLVAIVRTGSGIGALQSFTSDKHLLLAAIDKIKWNPQGRGEVSAFKPYQKSFEDKQDEYEIGKNKKEQNRTEQNELLKDLDIDGRQTQKQKQSEIAAKKENEDFRNSNFSVGSLGALSYVIEGMKELPGRKSVMFVSEGFRTFIEDNGRNTLIKGKRVYNQVLGSLRNVAELANRSSVVIYTFDPRGLINPATLRNDPINNEEVALNDSQQTLRYLSYETGGIPYVDQNKMEIGLEKAINDQKGYYLIAYQPDSETFDKEKTKFNKLTVKVKRSGVETRYRSGFFGISDEKIAETKRSPQQQIYSALTSPFGADGIHLSLNTLFADDEKTGSFIRSLVSIDGKDLSFSQESNGMRKANFDIIAMTFGDNGAPVDQTAKNYTIQVNEEDYQKILKKGFIYNLFVPIKKPGAYQFRIALRDSASEKIGSASQFIEIPNLKEKKLTISSIILNNFTPDEIKKAAFTQSQNVGEGKTFSDTALRQFRRETVLRYDYVIYNAAANPPRLQVQARLFRDNQLVLEGSPSEINTGRQTNLNRIEAAGAITLGNNLKPGNYILQILVNDKNAKEKYSIASQIVDFEIIE